MQRIFWVFSLIAWLFSYQSLAKSAQQFSYVVEEIDTAFEFDFTEGPASDLAGNVYFSDIPNSKIYRWDSQMNQVELFLSETSMANGMIFSPWGELIICQMETGEVVKLLSDKQLQVLASRTTNNQIKMPNDVWADQKGGVYFSNFNGPGESVPGGLQIYYIADDGSLHKVTHDLIAPNGIIGNRDGTLLYVTDPGQNKTFQYTIAVDGSLTNKQLFVAQSTDGMAVDELDNVYFSGDMVSVFNAKGKLVFEIETPFPSANLTFAGAQHNLLFITAQKHLYKVLMPVRGAQTPWQRGPQKAP